MPNHRTSNLIRNVLSLQVEGLHRNALSTLLAAFVVKGFSDFATFIYSGLSWPMKQKMFSFHVKSEL